MTFSRVAIGILWAIISTTLGEKTVQVDDDICTDIKCQKFVLQVTSQMGNEAPCKDFHNYVCGKWEGSRELQPKDIKMKAIADLIQLLQNASQPTKEQLNATGKLINAYMSCTQTGDREEELRDAIKNVLAASGMNSWPTQNNSDLTKLNYKEILKRVGPRPLFSYYVSNEASSPILIMTKPKFFFVSTENVESFDISLSSRSDEGDSTTPDYSEYDNFEDKLREAYITFIVETIKLLNKTFPLGEHRQAAEEIFAFEQKLATYASEAKLNTTTMKLWDFINTLGDAVPMDEILNKDLKPINFTVTQNTSIRVEYEKYYRSVLGYLKNSSQTSALNNYIGWVIVRTMAEAEGTELHKLYLEYKNKTVVSGLDKQDTGGIETLCMRQLLRRNVMYSAAANVYSKDKFDKESKEEVMKIMKYVNITVQYVIKYNAWMSDTIKKKVQERLEKMNPVMGYPDWILDDDIINKLYQFVPYIESNKSFVEHFFKLRENDRIQNLLKLNSTYFDKSYEEVTLKSHAFYDEATDTMAYPAAALATHFRKPPIPRSVNYATVGTIIAQLFTAAMDRYDKIKYPNGTIVKNEFWDENTTASFCRYSRCLNNSEQCSDKGECYSDSYQKVEDYVGIRVSYKALQLSKQYYKKPFALNDTRLNTEDKIFFVLFGSLYCPYRVNFLNLEDREGKVMEKVHFVEERADSEEDSFSKSLNEVVSIFHKFNETFRCQENQSDTCHLVPENSIPEIGC